MIGGGSKLHTGKISNSMRKFVKGNWFFFVSDNVSDVDKELFFGPLDGTEEFIVLQTNWIMANVMHAAGLFPSAGQARKNGWNKPIPDGWTDLIKGKLKREITILNLKE